MEFAQALVEILQTQTKTAGRCWFAVWVGYALDEALRRLPRLVIPHREYYVATGPLAVATEGVYESGFAYQSASMWWPDDWSWFVSTEVDLAYTYVGGTRECIDAILAHPHVEALRAELGHRITWDSDTINPSPGPPE